MGATDTRSALRLGDLTWQARPHHRGRQPRRRPGAALHPLGCGGGQLPDRLDAAHLRPADQRVEGRRGAVPVLLGVAAGRGERRRVPPAGMRVIVQGRLKARSYETREGEKRTVFEIEVDEVGPTPEVRHRQGHPHQPLGRRRRLLRRRPAGRRPGRRPEGGDDPWATPAAASGGQSGGQRRRPQGGGQQGGGQTTRGRRPASAPRTSPRSDPTTGEPSRHRRPSDHLNQSSRPFRR